MSTKKLLLLAYVGSIIVLAACSSGKSAFEHGNYYEAVITSVNRLRKNDDHKKSIETLRQAYPMAVAFYEDRAKASLASNAEFKWTAVVESYATINAMYDDIRRCPGALKVIPNPVNYYPKLEEAKKNAAEENYAAGILALTANTRDKAKVAYGLFIKANGFVPGYKDVIKMTETALWNATVKVVMEPIPVASKNIKVSADFFTDKVSEYLHTASINQFVKFYTRKEAQTLKLNPDHVVKIEFDEFAVGQVFMNEKEFKLEKDSIVAATYVTNSGSKTSAPPTGAGTIVAGGTTGGVVAGNSGNTGNTQPTTGSTQPNTGTTQPNTGTTQPNAGTTQPNTGTTQPNTGTTQPSTGTTQPNTGSTQPNTGTTQPSTGTTQPNTGSTQPNTGTTQPSTGTTQPNTGTTPPNTGTTQPNPGNNQNNSGNTGNSGNSNTGNSQNNSGNAGNSGSQNSGNNGNNSGGNNSGGNNSNTPEDTTKVTICHIPPGNAAAAHTLVISRSALKAHLDHGDKEGACATEAKPKDDKKPNDNKGGNSKKPGNTSSSNRGPVFFASADNDPMKWLAYSEAAEVDTTKVYMTVKATYYYYKKTTTSKGVLSFKIIDSKTGAILSVEKMPGEYVWVSEWATFNGDERALSAEQLRITKQKEQVPPPAQDLFIGFTAPIYDQLVNKIKNFYANY